MYPPGKGQPCLFSFTTSSRPEQLIRAQGRGRVGGGTDKAINSRSSIRMSKCCCSVCEVMVMVMKRTWWCRWMSWSIAGSTASGYIYSWQCQNKSAINWQFIHQTHKSLERNSQCPSWSDRLYIRPEGEIKKAVELRYMDDYTLTFQ